MTLDIGDCFRALERCIVLDILGSRRHMFKLQVYTLKDAKNLGLDNRWTSNEICGNLIEYYKHCGRRVALQENLTTKETLLEVIKDDLRDLLLEDDYDDYLSSAQHMIEELDVVFTQSDC